jgi:hypothetical protein
MNIGTRIAKSPCYELDWIVMPRPLARARSRRIAAIADRDDLAKGLTLSAVDYDCAGPRSDPIDTVQADVGQRHEATQGRPQSDAASPPPISDRQDDEFTRALDLLLAGDDELERDLESPIRRTRGIVSGVALGAVLWALLLGAGALAIYY